MRKAAHTEYLWQADSADRGSRGICGDQAAARLAAEACMNTEGAPKALIRAATPGLGTAGLDDGWCPTGEAWLAARAPGGGIEWMPVPATGTLGEP
jgi:hypothetical protein